MAGGSGGKYLSRHRDGTQNVSPASAVTLSSHKRDEHNGLQYRLAGNMNINTGAARRCREWSGTDSKKIRDERPLTAALFVLLSLCKEA